MVTISFTFSGLWSHHSEGSEKNCCQSLSTILLWPAMNQGNHWNIIHPHGHCNRIVNPSNVHRLNLLASEQSNHIWTLKKLHTMAPCWSRTHQSNFIRNTHKIKQLRLQYIQMVIHNYCIIGNKRGFRSGDLPRWNFNHLSRLNWNFKTQYLTHKRSC